jgi:hypothetical protein
MKESSEIVTGFFGARGRKEIHGSGSICGSEFTQRSEKHTSVHSSTLRQ